MNDAERAERQRMLREAALVADACRKCPIGYDRRNNVYGEGDPGARLMVVGEGPGETEDELGRPFVGRAGQLLDRMLAAIGLPREHVYTATPSNAGRPCTEHTVCATAHPMRRRWRTAARS